MSLDGTKSLEFCVSFLRNQISINEMVSTLLTLGTVTSEHNNYIVSSNTTYA